MEGPGDGQRQSTLGARRLTFFTGARHRRGVAGNHDLPRGIEVHGFNHFTFGSFGAGLFHGFIRNTNDRGHAAHPDGHRRLHGFGSETHEFYGFFKRKGARGQKRRVFTETVPRGNSGLNAARGKPRAVKRVRNGQHGGLGVYGEVQFLRRAFCNEPREALAESGVGGFHHGRSRCVIGKARGHPHGLTSLSGKNKSDFHVDSQIFLFFTSARGRCPRSCRHRPPAAGPCHRISRGLL